MQTQITPPPSLIGQLVNGQKITSEVFSLDTDGSPIVFRFAGKNLIQRDVPEQPTQKPAGLQLVDPYASLPAEVNRTLKKYMRGGSCFQIALGYILGRCPTQIMYECDSFGLICPKGYSKGYWQGRGIRPWGGTKDPSLDQIEEMCCFNDTDGHPVRYRVEPIKITSDVCTLNRMAQKYPSSHIMCAVKGHCLAIVDGAIIDFKLQKGRRIEWAYIIHR